MKFDLAYLCASLDNEEEASFVVNAMIKKIKSSEYTLENGIKLYKLPPKIANLPKENKPKEETKWEKFAKAKGIKKNKKIYDKKTKKYVSKKKFEEEN